MLLSRRDNARDIPWLALDEFDAVILDHVRSLCGEVFILMRAADKLKFF